MYIQILAQNPTHNISLTLSQVLSGDFTLSDTQKQVSTTIILKVHLS